MRGSWREYVRGYQALLRPYCGEGIQTVRHGLAEYHYVGRDIEMLYGPELTGPEKSHLYLVVHKEDIVALQYLREALKVFFRRDDVSTRPLYRLYIKCPELGGRGLPVHHGVVLRLEKPFELLQAVEGAILHLLAV